MNIYVGNLAYGLTEEAMRDAFAAHGQVESARIIKDRETGQSKGFGFVEMPNQAEGEKAIKELDGADLAGRKIRVNEARPREGGGGGGGGGGRGGPRGGPRGGGGGGRY
jgi:RNA recognition motif-containing protein